MGKLKKIQKRVAERSAAQGVLNGNPMTTKEDVLIRKLKKTLRKNPQALEQMTNALIRKYGAAHKEDLLKAKGDLYKLAGKKI